MANAEVIEQPRRKERIAPAFIRSDEAAHLSPNKEQIVISDDYPLVSDYMREAHWYRKWSNRIIFSPPQHRRNLSRIDRNRIFRKTVSHQPLFKMRTEFRKRLRMRRLLLIPSTLRSPSVRYWCKL